MPTVAVGGGPATLGAPATPITSGGAGGSSGGGSGGGGGNGGRSGGQPPAGPGNIPAGQPGTGTSSCCPLAGAVPPGGSAGALGTAVGVGVGCSLAAAWLWPPAEPPA